MKYLEYLKIIVEILAYIGGGVLAKWVAGKWLHIRANKKQFEIFTKNWMEEIRCDMKELKFGIRNTRELAGILYWETDEHGKVTYVSPELMEKLGCTFSQLSGDSWRGLIVEKDRERVFRSWKSSVESASFFNEEFTFRDCDGKENVTVSAWAIHNKEKDTNDLNSSVVGFEILNNIHTKN